MTGIGPAIVISEIDAVTMKVPIVGTAPLLMHRFSEKAKRMMLDATQGRRTPKEPKDPHAEFVAAACRTKGDDGYGLPATAFKMATVAAARHPGRWPRG